MNKLQVFKNPELGELRSMLIDGEPWFVGKDVATALGYADPKSALSDHVDAEDKQIFQRGQNAAFEIPNRGLTIINESGLYGLILSSKLPAAKKFKRWVTSEVLPSIRKTGKYFAPRGNLVCDVPENHAAQRLIQETRDLLTTMNVLLDRYSMYRTERELACHIEVLTSASHELHRKILFLERLKYNLVERG